MLRASNLRDVGTKGTMGVRGGADLGQGGPEPAGESNVVPLLQPSSPASHLGKALEVDRDSWRRAERAKPIQDSQQECAWFLECVRAGLLLCLPAGGEGTSNTIWLQNDTAVKESCCFHLAEWVSPAV